MTGSALTERLREHRLLGDSPPQELEWLASQGHTRHLRIGEVLTSPKLGEVDAMFIVLSGRVGMSVNRTGVLRRVIAWSAGDVAGALPYSRLKTPPGTARAETPTDLLAIPRDRLPELIRDCPVVTTKLVGHMLDRARHFEHEFLHDARMASLGRLAAGLAHELDNPASAVVRGAKLLSSLLTDVDEAALALGASGITPEERSELESLRDAALTAGVREVPSPFEQARREEAMADWLAERGLDPAIADSLADSPVTPEVLDRIMDVMDRDRIEPALRWIAVSYAVRELAEELCVGATRISELVRATKGFTRLNADANPQPVNVEEGIAQTLAVLRAKARARSVRVTISTDPTLPTVRAVEGELNQVWSNLVDNAIDSAPEGGSIEVSAKREGETVMVSIVDDGPGVPDHIQNRIFDPFFTTKPVGQGTGLGLDIVRRLVDRHGGAVELSSAPGRTEFRVTLPVEGGQAEGATG